MKNSLLLLFCVSWLAAPCAAAKPEKLSFERHVAPLLRLYCWRCHGAGGLDGKLDLRTRPLLLRGGKSGPAIVPGSAMQSLLYRRLLAKQMPPDKTTRSNGVVTLIKPTPQHLETIRKWIDQGAHAEFVKRPLNETEDPPITNEQRAWWAFRKPSFDKLPSVKNSNRLRTPIDSFVLNKLEAKGIGFAQDASKLAIIRRLYLDLLGLPPTPQAVDRFLSDEAPGSYDRLVDELLGSPRFGERWGRHWLDAAGYVDTGGRDNDANIIKMVEGRWRYRDYVIRSLNRDKPYDEFVIEQLAGDEQVNWRDAKQFTDRHRELLVATGFLRQAADSTGSPELNTGDIRNQVLIDTVRLVGSNLMGITIQCAQCHTHKFDPINHADYYRFRAFFEGGYNIQKWKRPDERMMSTVSPSRRKAIDQTNARVKKETDRLRTETIQVRLTIRKRISAKKYRTYVPNAIAADVRKALATASNQQSTIQKYLHAKFSKPLLVSPAEISALLTPKQIKEIQRREAQIARLAGQYRTYQRFPAFWEESAPPRTYLFRRGEFEKPGAEVHASIPAVLNTATFPKRYRPANKTSSGQRSQLARWLTDPNHPLLARVYVNRIWQRYFGRGIVATPDNFGASGAKPTHPRLLDWLAIELVRQDWSTKSIHRAILLSTAYRQATHRNDASSKRGPIEVDPTNQLLWKMPLRRMPAEIVRDNLLSVSGALVSRFGGPPVPIKPAPDGMVKIDNTKLAAPGDQFRRTVYLTSRRNYHLTQLDVFNQPLVTPNCTRRIHSPVVSQSLAMMNSKFVMDQARLLADRVVAEGTDTVTLAFRFTLCRPPSRQELQLSRQLIKDVAQRYRETGKDKTAAEQAGLENLCHMLLNTSEFLYIP